MHLGEWRCGACGTAVVPEWDNNAAPAAGVKDNKPKCPVCGTRYKNDERKGMVMDTAEAVAEQKSRAQHLERLEELYNRIDGLNSQAKTLRIRHKGVVDVYLQQVAEKITILNSESIDDSPVYKRELQEQLAGIAAEHSKAKRLYKATATDIRDSVTEVEDEIEDVLVALAGA